MHGRCTLLQIIYQSGTTVEIIWKNWVITIYLPENMVVAEFKSNFRFYWYLKLLRNFELYHQAFKFSFILNSLPTLFRFPNLPKISPRSITILRNRTACLWLEIKNDSNWLSQYLSLILCQINTQSPYLYPQEWICELPL